MLISKKELGLLIKKARNLKSDKIGIYYSQKMLAKDINKSQSFIGDIESGRTYPSYALLTRISQACGVSMSFLDPREQLDKDLEYFIDQSGSAMDDKKWARLHDGFKTPEEALNMYLNCQAVQNFLGIDFARMSPGEMITFRDDMLNQMKLVSYKYKNRL